MVRRYQIRLMRSVNARCVSIGLVLALSNCSESGGEPDAMLDMHHPGTGIDSHHPQFHNSYGNMKFIIIVINPKPSEPDPPRDPKTPRSVLALALAAPLKSSNALLLAARLFFPPPVLFRHRVLDPERPSPTTRRQASLVYGTAARTSSTRRLEKWDSRPSTLKNYSLSFLLPPFIIYY